MTFIVQIFMQTPPRLWQYISRLFPVSPPRCSCVQNEGNKHSYRSVVYFYLADRKITVSTTGTGNVIKVPDSHQLAFGKLMAAAINMPVIKLTGIGALDGITTVFERAFEKRIGFTKFN